MIAHMGPIGLEPDPEWLRHPATLSLKALLAAAQQAVKERDHWHRKFEELWKDYELVVRQDAAKDEEIARLRAEYDALKDHNSEFYRQGWRDATAGNKTIVAQAVQAAVAAERERICTEALLWAHLSSNRSVSSALESFVHALIAGKGPFNDERLNEFVRAAALRAPGPTA